jgi:CheY-specific phosphatase CheX
MKVESINPFIQALSQAFQARFDMQTVHEPPSVRTGTSPRPWDVTTVAGIVGGCRGTVLLHCTSAVALKLASVALGSEVTELDDEAADTLVALLRDVLDTAAARSPDLDFAVATPVVLLGAGHRAAFEQAAPCISIPFETPAGGIEMEIALEEDQAPPAPEA